MNQLKNLHINQIIWNNTWYLGINNIASIKVYYKFNINIKLMVPVRVATSDEKHDHDNNRGLDYYYYHLNEVSRNYCKIRAKKKAASE